MAFGNGKSGTIIGTGKIGESLSNSIEDVYLVDGLKHNLLSVSQLCDKDNLVYSLRIVAWLLIWTQEILC